MSALLNQNPQVYVSPLSPLLNNLNNLEQVLNLSEETLSVNFEENTTCALQHFVDGFYKNISSPIIIDRNKGWGSKESIFTAYKYVTNNPKIIYTVRDIPSILASFVTLVDKDQDNFIDNSIRSIKIKPYGAQTQNDLRCDWLMNGQVGYSLAVLTEILQIGVSVCLIEYDDLTSNPQTQLNKIYDFLEMERYTHDFYNIKKIEEETLANVGLPNNLHDVRNKLEKTSTPAELILPELSLKKYSGLEFWR